VGPAELGLAAVDKLLLALALLRVDLNELALVGDERRWASQLQVVKVLRQLMLRAD